MSLVPEYDSDATSGSDAEVEPLPVLTNPPVVPEDASSPQLNPPPTVHGEEDYENEGPAAKARKINSGLPTCPAEYTTATAVRTPAESYPYATVDPAAYQYDYTAYYNGAYPGHGYDQTAIAAPATNGTAADFSLDDEALRKMGGRRALRAGVKLQDISQTTQLHNATTHTPAFQASAPPLDGPASASSGTTTAPDHLKPSQMQKRKNNIMSLAFQSVENETKIKELYASGRQSKRETQGKYGF
ncbi:hypothetical protein IWQ60_007439 [Tieghemiomyces parasiticus]|uniref:Mitotic checkpoint regulator, MAD2B-interacting-domain-containing protein n=1 Tax=Tieghemiomyces parasiticus TaxID=78921 RepID=A0A9W8DQJ9_9FUNG|nr:hypothetical protein IWQ60_007439 [Tieghemiomyces parasiticus]